MTKIRTYSELRRLETFLERYEYLSLKGIVGESTFGFYRWVNQQFYRSYRWKRIRSQIIIRDQGCDLGIEGYEIHSGLMIHHMNPISSRDIENDEKSLLDPDSLITTSLQTHNAIHFGDYKLLPRGPIVRQPGDTKLW